MVLVAIGMSLIFFSCNNKAVVFDIVGGFPSGYVVMTR